MDARAKTTAKKTKSMKPMTWSTVHDEMLCREILVVDPFTGTKKGTVARGTRWEEVAENLNKIQQIYFKVDKRAVRDRYNLLHSPSIPGAVVPWWQKMFQEYPVLQLVLEFHFL